MPPRKKAPPPPPPVNKAAEAFEARVAEATQYVDLDVEFTPVLPLPTGSHPAASVPVKVTKRKKGVYLLHWGHGNPDEEVTAEHLRVMRARYIVRHNDYYWKLPRMGEAERERVLNTFFGGQAVYLIGALELQVKQELDRLEKGDPTDDKAEFKLPEPILTIHFEEGNEEAKQAAISQAMEAMGPAKVITSRARFEQERPRTVREAFPVPVTEQQYQEKLNGLGAEITRALEEARNAPPPPSDTWRRGGPGFIRDVAGYHLQAWPAGSWSISRDGSLVKHGAGGREAADTALEKLMEVSASAATVNP